MKKYISQDITGRDNDWYWGHGNGFHDARIISIEHKEYNFDFHELKPIRNRLTILLDLVGIEKIYLYNYKIINNCNLAGNFWLCDTLSFENGKYVLEMKVADAKDDQKEYTFIVKFDKAERIIIND